MTTLWLDSLPMRSSQPRKQSAKAFWYQIVGIHSFTFLFLIAITGSDSEHENIGGL
jgi:hypothetical protein